MRIVSARDDDKCCSCRFVDDFVERTPRSRQKTVNNTRNIEMKCSHLGCLIPRKKRTTSLFANRYLVPIPELGVIFPCNKVPEKRAPGTNAAAIFLYLHIFMPES